MLKTHIEKARQLWNEKSDSRSKFDKDKNDFMPKRPGTGISPVYNDIVIGRRVV